MKKFIAVFVLIGLMYSCASMKKKETVISPYVVTSLPAGHSALVYALPQTRLFFEVELIKTVVKKGPYAEFANRMLGMQKAPTRDSESWRINSIRISDRQEVDSKQLYTVTFTDYPFNIDKLLRFTNQGLLMDLTVGNVVINNHTDGKSNDDYQLFNTIVRNTSVEKVDTLYKPVNLDTTFVHIPVLQSKVMSKTTEELAREAVDQIFNIQKLRRQILGGDVDYPSDGMAFITVLQTLDKQEAQLLSLFIGTKIETRQTVTYSAIPDKPANSVDLFYFTEKAGIVSKNTAGAKAVWYQTAKVTVPTSVSTSLQAKNIIYYRIPQIVEVSVGIDINLLVSEQITICQFGNIVSFPLIAPSKK